MIYALAATLCWLSGYGFGRIVAARNRAARPELPAARLTTAGALWAEEAASRYHIPAKPALYIVTSQDSTEDPYR